MENNSVVLYLLGKKGYEVLFYLVAQRGSGAVSQVVASRDSGVDDDFYKEIEGFCIDHGISFFDRKDFISNRRVSCSYGFCVGWRWIVADSERLIVFHDSLLPRYRGFAPLVNMLINAEPIIGVTALLASSEYDRGAIIDAKELAIKYPLKIRCAIEKIIPLYQDLVVQVYDLIAQGKLITRPQSENDATYSLWRDEDDYLIDWCESSDRISRFCDSVGEPYRGAKTYLNGFSLRILDAHPVQDVFIEDRKRNIGKIIFMDEGCPVVVCGSGLLKILYFKVDGDNVEVLQSIPFRSRFTGKYDQF